MATETAIQVTNLTKHYGRSRAIENLSFTIPQGSIVGLLGPNGAGKSTTLRILSGIMKASSGEAYICGTSVAQAPKITQKYIGYMPENNPLPDDMRVDEYLSYRAVLKSIAPRAQKFHISRVLELCDLHRTASKKMISRLSKGFRQRVGIADALLSEPKIIILDEPTIGLDPHQVLSIRNLFKTLSDRMTVVISSHILQEVEKFCSQMIIMNQGHIVAQGTLPSLREAFLPKNQYRIQVQASTDALKQSIHSMDPKARICLLDLAHPAEMAPMYLITTDYPEFSVCWLDSIRSVSGIKVHEIVHQQADLEAIFVEATKCNWKLNHKHTSEASNL